MAGVDFHHALGSPYAWRVWLALEHKGAAYKRTTLLFDAGDLKTPKFAALNPRRKVPVLVDDDFVLDEFPWWSSISKTDGRRAPRSSPRRRERAIQRRMVCEIDQYLAKAGQRLAWPRLGRIRKTFERSSPYGRALRPATISLGISRRSISRLSVHGALSRFAGQGGFPAGFHRPRLAAWIDRM